MTHNVLRKCTRWEISLDKNKYVNQINVCTPGVTPYNIQNEDSYLYKNEKNRNIRYLCDFN